MKAKGANLQKQMSNGIWRKAFLYHLLLLLLSLQKVTQFFVSSYTRRRRKKNFYSLVNICLLNYIFINAYCQFNLLPKQSIIRDSEKLTFNKKVQHEWKKQAQVQTPIGKQRLAECTSKSLNIPGGQTDCMKVCTQSWSSFVEADEGSCPPNFFGYCPS